VFVKICGVTRADDARAAADAGADAIGLNFWPSSKRHVTVEAARSIVRGLPPSLRRFGVFVNPTVDEVARAFDEGLIDTAQLHGDESAAFCVSLGRPWMKALRLRDLAQLDGWSCELLLVDADAPGYGGSGATGDWSLARAAAAKRNVLLAGGLTPENVAAAIGSVRPFGVDVASGVESSPGLKDARKVAAFVAAARAAAP
jgi:phosphoribosylanthranilate isomerase